MSKIYVFGDIHGCYDEFIELIEQIGITDEDVIVSLGDIVDRGNKSLELFHFFQKRKNAIVLIGNHERKHQKGILSYAQEIVKVQFGTEYEAFLDWVNTLPYYYETNDAVIVHAFFEHDKSLSEQKEEVLSGTTAGSRYLESKYEEGKYWSDFYTGSKPIIYGHHVVGDTPKIKNNTYGIDTAACHGGKLTALELPSFAVHQVSVKRDYWREEQAKWQVPVLQSKNWEDMKLEQVHKLIEKLEYKQEPEVKSFLEQQKRWIGEIENLLESIEVRLNETVESLKATYGDGFNQAVAKLNYKTFVFKANSNQLTLEYLKKRLNTPSKVADLARELNIDAIPVREKTADD